MSDYISKEDGVDTIKKNFKYLPGYMSATINYIKELPSADVAQVVRCYDCKYYGSRRWCELHSSVFDDNAFCSYGERREE